MGFVFPSRSLRASVQNRLTFPWPWSCSFQTLSDGNLKNSKAVNPTGTASDRPVSPALLRAMSTSPNPSLARRGTLLSAHEGNRPRISPIDADQSGINAYTNTF